MFSLLLTILLMAKEEIKLQSVQQPIEIEQRQETIAWIGYTQRAINAKTQTRNYTTNYCRVSANKTIASWTSFLDINDNIVTFSVWYSDLLWTPDFTSHWIVRIPDNWLYVVTAKLYLWSKTWSSNPTIWRKIEEFGGRSWYEYQLSWNWTFTQEKIITFTEYFNTWEKLMPKIFQNNWDNSSAVVEMMLVKIW